MTIQDKSISQLTSAGPIAGSELVEVVQAGQNVKATTGALRGTSIGKAMTSPYTASIANPISGMSWAVQRLMRNPSPFSPRLQTFLDECVQDCGFYSRSANLGTWSFVNGQLNIASTANTFGNAQVLFGYETFEFPGFSVALEGFTLSPDTGANVLAVGIAKDRSTNNALYCYIEIGNTTQNRITIAKIVAGSFTMVAQTSISSLPSGISGLCYTVEATNHTVWIQVNNSAWYPVLNITATDFNFLSASELVHWHPMFQATGGTSTAHKISRVRTGYSNAGAFRDFKLVVNKDGTPYSSNGYMYFTASNDYASIWRLNPKVGIFEKIGCLMFNIGGTVAFDLNPAIVWDGDANTWRVMFASWRAGLSTGVQIYQGTYNGDILLGVHTVTGTLVNVTQRASAAVYDESLVYDAANSRWLLSYSVSPGGSFGGNMYVAQDASTDLTTWTNLWAATGVTGYEGSAIAKIGGNWYTFAGNGSNFRCWDISGANLGTAVVDVFPPSAGNPPPHFVVFPWMDGDLTQYYALSWSNVQFQVGGAGVGIFGTGTPILYKATPAEAGFEFTCLGAT